MSELREVAKDAPLRDVAGVAEQFSHDLDFAKDYGLPIPTVDIPDVGRIPILGISERVFWGDFPPNPQRWERRVLSRSTRRVWPEENIRFEAPAVAQDGFFGALNQFLEYRLAGYAFWKKNYSGNDTPSSPFVKNGGLLVTLSCEHHHLRVSASMAVAVEWHQFGHPTSPVTGILQPGLWLFAADGGIFGSSKVVDRTPARIPPVLKPCATAF
ncbi:MAG TPA: hypothetical protein VEX43_11925 [Chthoniobacterales bacterium]|nr:hypothetical protein [Chthoniobacterales bacterium]